MRAANQVGKEGFRYRDIVREEDGYVDATKYAPFPYDLVEIILENGRKYSGWYTGNEYMGLRFGEVKQITKWRRDTFSDEI